MTDGSRTRTRAKTSVALIGTVLVALGGTTGVTADGIPVRKEVPRECRGNYRDVFGFCGQRHLEPRSILCCRVHVMDGAPPPGSELAVASSVSTAA